MARPDYKEFEDKIVFGPIPGGTGNGLIKSILDHGDENYGV